MKFTFGDIVVIDDIEIGVIVKCWEHFDGLEKTFNYDVYVRNYNAIRNYEEKDIQRYMVRHKCLNEEELEYQKNAIQGL